MGAKCRHEHRHQDAKVRYSLGASVLCGQSTATRSSAAGSLPLRKPAVGTSPPARLLRSRSSVSLRLVYTWPLFLHTSAGQKPARSVPGSQEAARWAAGADSVGASPPQTAPESLCLASPRTYYHDSGNEPSRLRAVRPSVSPSMPVSSTPPSSP